MNMEPGEMVLYESAKQYHARLTPMRGRHYGSLFIHYFPAEGWNWTSTSITHPLTSTQKNKAHHEGAVRVILFLLIIFCIVCLLGNIVRTTTKKTTTASTIHSLCSVGS